MMPRQILKFHKKFVKMQVIEIMMKKIIKYFRVLISLFNKLYLFSDKIWYKL